MATLDTIIWGSADLGALDALRWRLVDLYANAPYGPQGQRERNRYLDAIMCVGRLIGDWPEGEL